MGNVNHGEVDVVIVGGGLAGGFTGNHIAAKGYKVLILEEHFDIGKPLQCAGLVTTRVMDYIKPAKVVLNTIKGANIYSPKGNKLVIENLHQRTVVVDRPSLDRSLITDALRAGCDIFLGAKAVGASRIKPKKGLEVKYRQDGKSNRVRCKILIGADGVQSNVASWFELPKPELIVSGYGAEVTGTKLEPDIVTILAGQEVAPNFFAWIIPTNIGNDDNSSTTARVGLCIDNAPNPAYYYFNKLFTSNPISSQLLSHSQPLQTIAGAIPLGPRSKTYCDNVMVVGDAAGQAKPTSGGGIYTSLVCAKYCAETAIKALEADNYSESTLSKYQKLWNRELGKELRRGLMLHRAFSHLSDSQLEEGFRILNDDKLLKIISQHGDIDYPWKLAKIVFRKVPAMLKFAKPFIKALW